MGKSSVPVAKVPSRFSEQVTEKLESGKRYLEKTIPFATAVVRPRPKSVSAGPITNIIIICLSYAGASWNDDGEATLKGPLYDFPHLLRHFGYPDEKIQFNLLHDFDPVRYDSDGQEILIDPTHTSKAAIMEVIENTMQSVAPDGKVVFYFGGHGVVEEEQSIVAGDREFISGSELRTCFNNTPYDSVSVVAIFDACHSGGSMGLPYNYATRWLTRGIRPKRVACRKQEVPMIQISAARRDQSAHSDNDNDDGVFSGRLTRCLLQYLATTTESTIEGLTDPTIEGLTAYLYENCGPSGRQKPQVSASHPFRGMVSFF